MPLFSHKWNIWGVRGAVLALALLGGVTACRLWRAPSPPPTRTFLTMGTLAAVTLPPEDSARLDAAAALVTNTMAELDARFSVYQPDSELSRLNAQAGKTPLRVSAAMINLLELSKHYGALSEGAFDVTVGPLMRAWGFNGGQTPERPLTTDQLQPLIGQIGHRHIVLEGETAFVDSAEAQVDLGGIAKGYAVDVCCHKLLGAGIPRALVDLGGNIRCLGTGREGRPWRVAVRNPFRPAKTVGVLTLANGLAVATSGNYERFVTIAGRRYAHIVDPRTGLPVEGLASVTVLAPSAVEADALSTTLFVRGLRDGMVTLKKTADCEALFVPDRQPLELWVTPGFAARFTPEPALSNRVFVIK